MADSNQETALVKVSDIFGVSKPAIRLIEAVERGVGNFLQPWQMQRITSAEISNFERWQLALEKTHLVTKSAELTLQDRAAVRLVAQEIQRQSNREAIALEAAKEFKESIEGKDSTDYKSATLDIEWVDRFWRLAQDVTNAEMQAAWGRVLARQTTGRGSYSARCLETISLLSREEVSYLEKLATFHSCTMLQGSLDHFFLHSVSNLQGKKVSNEIQTNLRLAVGDTHKEIFGPAGILLDSGSGWAQSAVVDVSDGVTKLTIAKKRFVLIFANKISGPTHLGSCVGVSPVGGEIFSLISSPPDATYIQLLTEALRQVGIEMKEE